MRLMPEGPDVPDDLLRAHDQGDTVFLCGAGVSIHAGLPGFRDLVTAVYSEHNERWEDHQRENEAMGRRDYESVLDHLEARLGTGIRHAVARKLLPAEENHNLSSHRVLLQLCLYGRRHPRILTTNYDHLFEQAWLADQDSPIPIHILKAIPYQKKAECTGILYLHGRVEEGPNSLANESIILTSTDFGEAYVGGWASPYLYDAIRAHSMVLVGYSAEDPLFRYLMKAIDADRRRLGGFNKAYAFAECEPGEEAVAIRTWQELGIDPILYDATEEHVALHRTLEEWLSYGNNPRRWRREAVGATFARPPSPSDVCGVAIERAIGILRYDDPTSLLGDTSAAPEWVGELTNRGFFDDCDESPAYWIANRLDDPDMIKTCAGLEVLDARTATAIGQELQYGSQVLTPVRRRAWRLIIGTKRPGQDYHQCLDWHSIEEHLELGDSDYHVRAGIAKLLRPALVIQRPFPFMDASEVAGDGIWNYVRADYLRKPYPGASAVLRHWPNTVADNRNLIHPGLFMNLRVEGKVGG